jgi:hypothetical protein
MGSFYSQFDSIFEHLSKPVYYTLIVVFYVMYFATMFGIAYVQPEYLATLNRFIHLFIGVILVLRFNPYRTFICSKNDQRFIFTSATILLLSTGITETLEKYVFNIYDSQISPLNRSV